MVPPVWERDLYTVSTAFIGEEPEQDIDVAQELRQSVGCALSSANWRHVIQGGVAVAYAASPLLKAQQASVHLNGTHWRPSRERALPAPFLARIAEEKAELAKQLQRRERIWHRWGTMTCRPHGHDLSTLLRTTDQY